MNDQVIELPKEPAKHQWWIWCGLECCKICGIVRRSDDKNLPCVGTVKVGLRGDKL